MKFFLFNLLLSSTLLVAANNKITIKKEFSYNNANPSELGVDNAFYVKGRNWIDGLNGLKAFSKCKLIEIDELGQKDRLFKAKLTAECISK
jgi:hypothetical protein